jgi:hypothetical protein
VPKPQKEPNGICDAWRVNFYHFEIEILRDFGNIKPAIKLVKVIGKFRLFVELGKIKISETSRQHPNEKLVQLCDHNCCHLDEGIRRAE